MLRRLSDAVVRANTHAEGVTHMGDILIAVRDRMRAYSRA
jgi:hypothetical protein